jgi:hypothetical protein
VNIEKPSSKPLGHDATRQPWSSESRRKDQHDCHRVVCSMLANDNEEGGAHEHRDACRGEYTPRDTVLSSGVTNQKHGNAGVVVVSCCSISTAMRINAQHFTAHVCCDLASPSYVSPSLRIN